jgi:hypothetical protein
VAALQDPDDLLREAEDEIEAWLCELDREWARILADADATAAEVVATARVEAARVLDDAAAAARARRAEADAAAEIVLQGAEQAARERLAEADTEFERLRMIAAEHADAVRALAAADAAAARGAAREDLTGIRDAVGRLRAELSRVVDAAFDALPAVEATAGALDRVMEPDASPTPDASATDDDDVRDPDELVGAASEVTVAPRRPGRLRRLLRLGR